MHHIISILFLLLTAAAAHARQFVTEWMTAPSPGDSSCQWFRRTFVAEEVSSRPMRAAVSIATASRFILYVNGRNVSAAIYSNATAHNNTPSSTTFDVTRFLRPDSNTVAVLACPTAEPCQGATTAQVSPPHISICFFGSTCGKRPFAFSSADGWLCHSSSTAVTAGGETMDGRNDALFPAYGDMVMAQWQPVAIVCHSSHHASHSTSPHRLSAESLFGYNPLRYSPLTDTSAYIRHTLLPRYFDTDGHTVSYDFSPGFYGLVRVTLRGCRRGERIRIGDSLTYICSGEIDEQAVCRFSPQYARKIAISGDSRFRPEQVQEVEVLGL